MENPFTQLETSLPPVLCKFIVITKQLTSEHCNSQTAWDGLTLYLTAAGPHVNKLTQLLLAAKLYVLY